MSIVWAILSKVEFLVGWWVVEVVSGWHGGWGGLVGFGPNILSLLVLIEIGIRIKTRL